MDSIFHFNFGHEPNASGDLAIPISIPSHFDSDYEPNASIMFIPKNDMIYDVNSLTNY